MNEFLIQNIKIEMEPYLNQKQKTILNKILRKCLKNFDVIEKQFNYNLNIYENIKKI